MESELRVRIDDTNTYDVLAELQSTKSQIILMGYEYMDSGFFQLWWKETPAEKVTWKKYKIHEPLVYDLDY